MVIARLFSFWNYCEWAFPLISFLASLLLVYRKSNDFSMVTLYPDILLKTFIRLKTFCFWWSFLRIISCRQQIRILFCLFLFVSILFLSLIVLSKTSSTTVNKSGESKPSCSFQILEEILCFSSLSILLHISLLYIAFIMLRYIPFVPSFFMAFIMKEVWAYQRPLVIIPRLSYYLFPQVLFICWITLTDLSMLN